jgi:hypothetical protein
MSKRKCLTGTKVHMLNVIEEIPGGKDSTLVCACECGNIVSVSKTNVMRGNTKSCGCLRKRLTGERFSSNKPKVKPVARKPKPVTVESNDNTSRILKQIKCSLCGYRLRDGIFICPVCGEDNLDVC